MVATAILNFEKLLLFLHYWTNAHLIWWKCCESDMERTVSSRNANSSKVKFAAAAILNCEELLRFLYYSIDSHQTWWGCCKFDVEYATVESVMSTRFILKYGGCRHIKVRKDVAIPLLLNRSHRTCC